jgi:fructose-1,6-bisphosphatase/inositol monophosphatase family enzyme
VSAPDRGASEGAYARELSVVLTAVAEAAARLRAEAARTGGPRGSRDHAPVDGEIGDALCARLEAAFPADGLRCEDGGQSRKRGQSGRAFVIDPHDGTRDFLRGRRETSISVALVDRGQLVLGVVTIPCVADLRARAPDLAHLFENRDEWQLSWAAGEPLRLNGRVLTLSPARPGLDEDSIVLVSAALSPAALAKNRRALAPARVVTCASIATRLALVAAGRADVGLTLWNRLAAWDFAGGQALLQGSGGDLVDERGTPIAWRGIDTLGEDREAYVGARALDLARAVAGRFFPSS